MLTLLSCARCSSYAGHFADGHHQLTLAMRPNLTLCTGFCEELWNECGRAFAPLGRVDHDGVYVMGAREFCEGQLGLRLAPGDDAPCFAGARIGSMPAVWLSLGVPLVLAGRLAGS